MGPTSLEILQEVKEVEKFWCNVFDFVHPSPDSAVYQKMQLIKFLFKTLLG